MPIKVSRILHAGYVFECDDTQIAFDPIFENPFSVNCFAFPNVSFDLGQIQKLKFAAVFLSHYHDDHCSFESLNLLDRSTPIYLYCLYDEMFSLLKELGFQKVFSLRPGGAVEVGPFKVTPMRALGADVDSIFHLQADGLHILNVVDSWIDPSTLDLLTQTEWDLILWPFQTMREMEVIAPSRAQVASREIPPELIEQLQILQPKYVVPSSCQLIQESWSWYRKAFFPISYRQFQKQVSEALPNSRVLRMNPSVSFLLDQNLLQPSRPLTWVRPLGGQNLDYEYDENVVPPPTAEIATHFLALSPEQTEKVFTYCRSGLIEKFKMLESSEDPYFKTARIWQLSAYDRQGVETRWTYKLEGAKMQLLSKPEKPDWVTEIPLAKLYGALEEGETLTSLYVRIDGALFEELTDDPLLRCLYQGSFGAYQKAQLKRLRSSGLVRE